jgi:hypothetical protein
MKFLRIVVGFALAPLVGLVLFILVAGVFYPVGDSTALFGFACLVAYAIALVVGVPAVVALHLLKFLRWWHYFLAGALVGVVGIVLITFNLHDPRIYNESIQLIASALLGAVSALVFWLVAVYQPGQAHAA